MQEYIIDFSAIRSIDNYRRAHSEFYTAIIKGLELPDWCGHGPDAVWDLMIPDEDNTVVYVKNIDLVPEYLDMHKRFMLEVFSEAEEWHAKQNKSYKVIID